MERTSSVSKEGWKISSTWKTNDSQNICDSIIFHAANTDDVPLSEELYNGNCHPTLLEVCDNSSESPSDKCTLQISSKNSLISRLCILSEARVVEVYGNFMEYLQTQKGDYLDELDDIRMYQVDIELKRPIQDVCLKFHQCSRAAQMYLYGVKIYEDFSSPVHQTSAQSSLAAAMEEIMRLKMGPLPAFAKYLSCVQGQQNYMSRESSPKGAYQNGDGFTHLKRSPIPLESVEKQSSSTQTEEGNLKTFENSSLEESLTTFFTDQMAAMEERLWERINKRFQETETKLMCKMEEIESFVKPQGLPNS